MFDRTITYDIGPNALGLIRDTLKGLFSMGQRFDELSTALAALDAKQAEAVAAQQATQAHVLEVVTDLKAQVVTLQTTVADLNAQLAAGGLTDEETATLKAKIDGATTAMDSLIAGIRAIDPKDPTTLPPAEPPAP